MGIQGLLPLLKPIHKEVNLSQFSGQTIGIDTYCWLHKGAYGCAMEIVEGKKTNVYLNYVIKRLNMMLHYNVKPYLVLDGGHLPSKANKEAERRKSRQDNKAKGLAFLRAGNKSQAYDCFQKCVDITPEMALEVIKMCRERNIDYIVAPYEADSQLAYLMKTGVTQATISEDSDLLVYGCNKVIFKMDECGAGTLVDIADLPKLKDLKMHEFTLEKFRHMCILSGCDYLPSIKGVGLKTANKLIQKHSSIQKLVRAIRLENKMKVPTDYEKNFKQADETFLYQLVFDPKTHAVVPLTTLPDTVLPGQLDFAGPMLTKDKALGIALGNINPITHEVMDDYDPTNNECDKPFESKIEKSSTCAFSFTNSNSTRQSLTPSSFLNNTQNCNNEREDARSSCRRFLLPPLKPSSNAREDSSADQDLLSMYTILKHKKSTTQNSTKQNRLLSHGCGLSRKPRMKNPFRATNDVTVTKTTAQTSPYSSYFKTSNPFGSKNNVYKDNITEMMDTDKDNITEMMDTDKDNITEMMDTDKDASIHELTTTSDRSIHELFLTPEMPTLPVWNDNVEESTSEEEEQNENSPIESSFSNLSSRQDRSPGKALERTDCSSIQQEIDSQKHSSSDSSIHYSVNKPLRALGVRTQDDPLPPKTTPMRSLHKFIYQPKLKDNIDNARDTIDKDIKSMDLIVIADSEVTADSGYLSDTEDNSDADTPCSQRQSSTDRVQNSSVTPCGRSANKKNVVNPIQLKSARTKPRLNGLSRCKSLGISKRKYTTKNSNTSGNPTLFSYFEYNKTKKPRLESSQL